MSRTPLFDSLKQYNSKNNGYFRIPGHRFERGIPKQFVDFAGKSVFRIDVTETPMADDLHKPANVIADSQIFTAEAFGAGQSFYLVNGTSCGNESMIIAAAERDDDGTEKIILVPRNAHKSVMAGLILSGARPVYLQPDYIEDFGITGVLNPETVTAALENSPRAGAVFAVSPSYHGICSNIEAIKHAAHKKNLPLLVDEAHGAHLYFSKDLPSGALSLGADACAQSLHKTCGALTQASLLHLSRETLAAGRLDPSRIDSALRMTMSTSPSYILMTSIELARADLEQNGAEYWAYTINLAEETRLKIRQNTGFRCPGTDEMKAAGAFDYDPTRLIINCDGTGINGYKLKDRLWEEFGIDIEMADSRNILLLFSYGNTGEEASVLISALTKISKQALRQNTSRTSSKNAESSGKLPAIPEMALTPRQAYYSKTRRIPWNDMAGKISAEPAAPYPPGIPILYPGEIISQEIFEFLDRTKKEGRHMHGLSDQALETIKVCME